MQATDQECCGLVSVCFATKLMLFLRAALGDCEPISLRFVVEPVKSKLLKSQGKEPAALFDCPLQLSKWSQFLRRAFDDKYFYCRRHPKVSCFACDQPNN